MGRWDWLEGLRRQSAAEAIGVEAARQIADEILAWPPAVEWEDDKLRVELAPVMTSTRPETAALVLGFQLARWELERRYDAIDHAMRNDTLGQLGDKRGQLAARFLWRWLPEWLLELKERCGGKLTREDLVGCLDLAERRVLGHLAQA